VWGLTSRLQAHAAKQPHTPRLPLPLPAGESLVSGMVAGSAVAFKATKGKLDEPEVLCYASKSEGMFVDESLIFRSDSNGEDLEGYAGAGRAICSLPLNPYHSLSV